MAAAPSRLAGLHPRKGELRVGSDADLVIWDPDAEGEVDATRLFHRHPLTPYDGRRLRGRVLTTMLRGRIVYDAGACVGGPGGTLL
jgi:allantoinase